MKIVVGSTSTHKLAAVRQACDIMEIAAEVRGVEIASTVAAQPFGLDEIVRGAESRSLFLGDLDFAIGVESGIVSAFSSKLIYFDVAAVVVRRQNEIVGRSLTTGIVFPVEFVSEALRRGPGCTVGTVMHERVGSRKTDGSAHLTGDRYTRIDQIAAGVIAAFAQAGIP